MGVKCEIFQLYPMLGLLEKRKNDLSIEEIYPELKHVLGWEMDQEILKYVIIKGRMWSAVKGDTNIGVPNKMSQSTINNPTELNR